MKIILGACLAVSMLCLILCVLQLTEPRAQSLAMLCMLVISVSAGLIGVMEAIDDAHGDMVKLLQRKEADAAEHGSGQETASAQSKSLD